MQQPGILIAGIGNIFLGDDAFGVEVARRLAGRPQPDEVRVVDFGIRGFDLAYALMEDLDLAILIDAAPRGHPPGTLYVIEPDLEAWAVPGDPEASATGDGEPEASATGYLPSDVIQTHGMNPMSVLRLVRAMGGQPCPLRVVGCEPAVLGTEEDPVMGLSQPVQAAVSEAVRLIEALITESLMAGRNA